MPRLRDEQKVEDIFQATLHLVVREGFGGLKMSVVAKQAGVATGTLYIYFKNKEELVNKLYLHLKQRKTLDILRGYQVDAPFLKSVELLWMNFFQASLKSEQEAVFLEQYYRSPYLKETVKQQRDVLLAPFYQLLQKGKNEGHIPAIDTELLLAQLVGPIHELVKLHFEGRLLVNNQVMKEAFELACKGIMQ